VRIVEPATGETVPCGTVGELCTRGYLVMRGYYQMPDVSSRRNRRRRMAPHWRPRVDGRSWLLPHRGSTEGHIRGGENIFPRPDKDELDAYVRVELAAYKAPRIWVFVDEFPMTPSGKVQKFVLRDRFLADDLRPV
jgi:acyl-CoA synthetase (AMP-forming)/AMP-acid ligase II